MYYLLGWILIILFALSAKCLCPKRRCFESEQPGQLRQPAGAAVYHQGQYACPQSAD